jgi:hypothetical protein
LHGEEWDSETRALNKPNAGRMVGMIENYLLVILAILLYVAFSVRGIGKDVEAIRKKMDQK